MKFTFELRWPHPFDRGWRRYPNSVFDTAEEASDMLSAYLTVGARNNLSLEGRIVPLTFGSFSRLSHEVQQFQNSLWDHSRKILTG